MAREAAIGVSLNQWQLLRKNRDLSNDRDEGAKQPLRLMSTIGIAVVLPKGEILHQAD
ncbi:hypothetical protein G7A66_13155 [Altererythrobacter sp. SALINAS58]|uniref:hypothetical protein n=1 Tax=Alteripontixanthobacter muriae TaxID=2705546 RepID=UPI0019D69D01|nr:hypothetical protein [Alteripontixanthobacter muriae]NTZ44009.1 hypothetical protein [Alteripontixanthobacter muriae]